MGFNARDRAGKQCRDEDGSIFWELVWSLCSTYSSVIGFERDSAAECRKKKKRNKPLIFFNIFTNRIWRLRVPLGILMVWGRGLARSVFFFERHHSSATSGAHPLVIQTFQTICVLYLLRWRSESPRQFPRFQITFPGCRTRM